MVVRRAHQLPHRSYIKARYWPPTASPTPCWHSTRPPISPSTAWSARSSAVFFVGECYVAASPRRRPTTLPFPPRPSPSRRRRPPVTPAVATAVGQRGRAARARPRFALWTPTSLQSLARTVLGHRRRFRVSQGRCLSQRKSRRRRRSLSCQRRGNGV